MRNPQLVRAAVIAGMAAALLPVLVGCAVVPAAPAVRSTPDALERHAVEAAALTSGMLELSNNGAWVQLWTTAAAPQAIASCVGAATDGAFTVSGAVDSNGGFGYSFSFEPNVVSTADDMIAAEETVGRCAVAHPVDTRIFRLAVSKQAALYSYDVTVLRRCLLSHGQPVAAAPGRASFERRLRAGLPWSPYDAVVVSTRAQWYALSDACPAMPSDLARGL